MFPFKTAINTSTLFPFNLNVKQQIEVAAKAGFQGVEVWVKDLDAYINSGGTMRDLRSIVADSGIEVVNAIAFFAWADADAPTRTRALDQAKREMTMLAEMGCPAVAAPPYGNVATNTLDEMATAFAVLADHARSIGVEPYLEFWGRAPRLSRLSEAMYVAIESGVSDVKLLLDSFHMYTGGSDIDNLAYLRSTSVGIVHVNDYPAMPARGEVGDQDRVFPGEGVASTRELARRLADMGYNGYLSLELFRGTYEGMSAVEVARHGLATIHQAYQVDP